MTKRPNFLIFMVDQLNGTFFPDGPAEWLHAPNLRRLSERSVRFANAYTPFPQCAPARASFMTGRLPSEIGVFDNAAEFGSDIPTFAHLFRSSGYRTCLSGKMHFVGADQLHGFEERLTTDIYPADYGWTPDYRRPGERVDWWYHNLGSVKSAGTAEVTHQLDYDDEVAYRAVRKVHEFGRSDDPRPWMMAVSFTHPHDPYVARQKHWDLQKSKENFQPRVGAIPYEDLDPHSQRLFDASDWRSHELADEDIMRSRRAYFANISYIDEKIGEVLDAVEAMQQSDNTIVVFLSDHGDMLGERGLWFKMNFFEGSARVPLTIGGAGIVPGLVDHPVSIVDMAATLAELAGIDAGEFTEASDGQSLVPDMQGRGRPRPVYFEYTSEGSQAPVVGVRDGTFKFVHCDIDPPMLFDLDRDPDEMTNLADSPEHADERCRLARLVSRRWNLGELDTAIRASQARRLSVYDALRKGRYHSWDYQPVEAASEQYMRNHMNLNVLDETSRFPRPYPSESGGKTGK